MWIDSRLEFSDAQALTATAAGTDTVDIGSDRDVGPGHPLYLVVTVDVALDDTDADETYVVDLETDSTSAFSSATTLATLTFTRGDVAGTTQFAAVPATNEQHFRVNYTLGGTTPSGTFSAWLTHEQPDSWVSYPDAVN